MKTLLIALVLTLPAVAPLHAATGLAMLPQLSDVQIERRSNHCNTLAQILLPRCYGI